MDYFRYPEVIHITPPFAHTLAILQLYFSHPLHLPAVVIFSGGRRYILSRCLIVTPAALAACYSRAPVFFATLGAND